MALTPMNTLGKRGSQGEKIHRGIPPSPLLPPDQTDEKQNVSRFIGIFLNLQVFRFVNIYRQLPELLN